MWIMFIFVSFFAFIVIIPLNNMLKLILFGYFFGFTT